LVTSRKRNPQARREHVDTLTGARVRAGQPGSRPSGRLVARVRAKPEGELETVVVDPEELDPNRDTFGVDPSATGRLREAAGRAGKIRPGKAFARDTELDLGRAGATTTFTSPTKAAEQFMRNNAAVFESPLFEDADVHDATRDFMDGIEVRQGRGKRAVRLSKTHRGEEILAGGGRASGGAIAKEMLAYLFGQAGSYRRWRDVPWSLVTAYVDAVVRVMQDEGQRRRIAAPSTGVSWYPLSSGVYGPEEVVSIAIDELGEAKARKLADWLNSQSLFDLSDRLESVLKPPKGSVGKKGRRAKRCLGTEDRKAIRRRVAQIRKWAADPESVPQWACVASRETQTSSVPVCMFPALEEEIRRAMDACDVPYDPSWPLAEHDRLCSSGTRDESGLPPEACPDVAQDSYVPDDEMPWENPTALSDFDRERIDGWRSDAQRMMAGERIRGQSGRVGVNRLADRASAYAASVTLGRAFGERVTDPRVRAYGDLSHELRSMASANPAKPKSNEWIAKRQTAQGTTVRLWPDGSLTWGMGHYIEGSPHARTPKQIEKALEAGWLVLGEVEIYDDAEVPDLIRAARWTADRDGLPGTLRKRLHERTPMRPVWTVIEADRDGRPLVRAWVLPRIAWTGLAVWNDRGTYSVWTQIGRTGTYRPTGVEFSNLKDLTKYLDEVREDRPRKNPMPMPNQREHALSRRIAAL
jgi:hypothetical protein